MAATQVDIVVDIYDDSRNCHGNAAHVYVSQRLRTARELQCLNDSAKTNTKSEKSVQFHYTLCQHSRVFEHRRYYIDMKRLSTYADTASFFTCCRS